VAQVARPRTRGLKRENEHSRIERAKQPALDPARQEALPETPRLDVKPQRNFIMGILSTIGKGASTAVHAAGNSAISTGTQSAMNGLSANATNTMNSALQDGVASQAAIALAQVQASTEQLKIGAAQQEANSTLHMAENAIATAVKFQNKMSDDAKDAI
jgi:hypothetical protein